MPDIQSVGGAVNSFGEGFLQGRQARIAQQQQDLEQQKYQFMKQQQAVTNAQKKRQQDIEEAGEIGQYGTQGQEYQAARDNPQSPDVSNAGGGGILNRPPGSGFFAQNNPYSTVPSMNAQANPDSQQAQQPQNGGLPSFPSHAIQMFNMQQKAEALKEVRTRANEIASKGGHADVVMGPQGPMIDPNTLDLGPQANAEINNLKHGGRSAENAINTQYNEDTAVQTARGSQVNMAQMKDAYDHPSPYGDASMVLNAFKIKNPKQAPDVNSIEEFQHSQSVDAQWKAKVSQALNGQFDQTTRDNLMRDAMSAFRGNTDSLRAEQSKFVAKAKNAGVNAGLITSEPAVDKTRQEVDDLEAKLGPYIPPTERSGFLNSVKSGIASLAGVKTGQTSSVASDAPPRGLSFEQFKAWKKQHGGQKK